MKTAPGTDIRHRSLDDLRATLPHIRLAPRDEGIVRLVVRRPSVEAREVLDAGDFTPEEGLVGDSWHARACSRSLDRSPHPDMQITIMSVRAIGAISPDETRWPLAGDQLFVDLDLTYDHLSPGTTLRVGECRLEVTEQLHTGCGKFVERFGVDAMKWVNSPEGRALNLRGIYARVVTAGRVRPGDTISRESVHPLGASKVGGVNEILKL
jgi:MOSC domain-containing protein YiiM